MEKLFLSNRSNLTSISRVIIGTNQYGRSKRGAGLPSIGSFLR